jgi:hypothetical protein
VQIYTTGIVRTSLLESPPAETQGHTDLSSRSQTETVAAEKPRSRQLKPKIKSTSTETRTEIYIEVDTSPSCTGRRVKREEEIYTIDTRPTALHRDPQHDTEIKGATPKAATSTAGASTTQDLRRYTELSPTCATPTCGTSPRTATSTTGVHTNVAEVRTDVAEGRTNVAGAATGQKINID